MADRHVSHLLGVPHAQLNDYIRLLSFYQMRKAIDPSTRIPAPPAFKLEAKSEDHAKMKAKRVDQTQQNALSPPVSTPWTLFHTGSVIPRPTI
jgi:hypothetical protein